MKRKVIQLAHKTLVVSLPSKWTKSYGVQKGAELEAEERGQQVIFSTKKRSESERVRVDASEMDSNALKRWVLSALHKTGYDEIEVMYKDPKAVRVLHETVKELLTGFAIVEQASSKCVIRAVAEEQEKEFGAVLRRAFLVTKGMGEGIYEYLKAGKQKELGEFLVLEKTNNQMTNFCERLLNKKGYIDDRKRGFAYVVAWNLEKTCDDYAEICEYLSGNKAKPGGKTVEILKEANRFFESYYELFYKFDIGELSTLEKKRKEITGKIDELLRSSRGADTMVLCTLKAFTTRVSDFSASFIGINIK